MSWSSPSPFLAMPLPLPQPLPAALPIPLSLHLPSAPSPRLYCVTLCPPALLPNCTKRLAPLVVLGCPFSSLYTPSSLHTFLSTPPPLHTFPPLTSPSSLPFSPALSLSNVNLSLCPLLWLPLWHLPQHNLRPAVLQHLTESYRRRYKLLYGGRGAATWRGTRRWGQAQRSILQGKVNSNLKRVTLTLECPPSACSSPPFTPCCAV